MDAILGALKGVSRGLLLLLLAVVFPGLAWIAAGYAESSFGMGFKSTFFGVMALEVFLGICALFGIASEIQERHRPTPGGTPEDDGP